MRKEYVRDCLLTLNWAGYFIHLALNAGIAEDFHCPLIEDVRTRSVGSAPMPRDRHGFDSHAAEEKRRRGT